MQVVRGDEFVALTVVVCLALMDRTIELDDDTGRMTVEVGYEAINNLLPPEM